MNIRDLLNKLDEVESSTPEGQLDEFAPLIPLAAAGLGYLAGKNNNSNQPPQQGGKPATDPNDQTEFKNEHLKKLYDLLDQLEKANSKKPAEPAAAPSTPPTTPKQASESIAKELTESFGYEYNSQLDEDAGATKQSLIAKYGNKASWVINGAMLVWDAYQQSKDLPKPSNPNDLQAVARYRSNIAKIWGGVLAEFGVFWVGAAFGELIGGTIGASGGPLALAGAILGGVVGGFSAQAAWGDDADKFISFVIDKIYPEGSSKTNTSQSNNPTSGNKTPFKDKPAIPSDLMESGVSDPTVQELQTALEKAGFKVGPWGIDGKFGPDTVKALQAYKASVKLPTDADAIAKLLNVPIAESIVFNKLSESEKMAYLKNKLTQLDESSQLNEWEFRLPPEWEEKAAKYLPFIDRDASKVARQLGKDVEFVLPDGTRVATDWERVGDTTRYVNKKDGRMLDAREMEAEKEAWEAMEAEKLVVKGVPAETKYVYNSPDGRNVSYYKNSKGNWIKYDEAQRKWVRTSEAEGSAIEKKAAEEAGGSTGSKPGEEPAAKPEEKPTGEPNKEPGEEAAGTSGKLDKSSFPSRLFGLLKNKKFWALGAALLAFHYAFKDGNIEHLFGGDDNKPSDRQEVPPTATDKDKKPDQGGKPSESETPTCTPEQLDLVDKIKDEMALLLDLSKVDITVARAEKEAQRAIDNLPCSIHGNPAGAPVNAPWDWNNKDVPNLTNPRHNY